MLIVGLSVAQTAPTARGFSSAASGGTHVSFATGLPFFGQVATADGSVSEGIMHAQLIRNDIDLAGCQTDNSVSPSTVFATTNFFQGYEGIPITIKGVNYIVFPAGTYDSTTYDGLHYNWDSQFNYDSLTTLLLNIYPVYELFDTLYLDSTVLANYAYDVLLLPATEDPLHGGPNEYDLLTADHGCDSIMNFYVKLCGGTQKDADGNEYASVFIGEHPYRYCWTTSNMRTTHYPNGNPVSTMVYYSDIFNNEAEDLDTYGYLYNWYAAVNLPEGSTATPPTTTNGGFVTGICPTGWHIPDSLNLYSLMLIDATQLRSTDLWLINDGTNSTGFNARPAGRYNSSALRFENLLGETHFWSCLPYGTSAAAACSLYSGCVTTLKDHFLNLDGLSVRCVKNHVYDADGNELND